MGGLVGGLFDLFSGNPAQKEQNQFGALGNYQTGVGEGLTTAGAGFDLGILSGDPTKIAQTLAPEISAGQTQVEQQQLENANFGNRAGGTNASTQNAAGAERGNIINLVGGLRQGTAGQALSAGGGLLQGASSNIGNEADIAEQRRSQLTSDVNGIAQGAAEIAMPFLGAAGTAGGAVDALDTTGGADPLQLNPPPNYGQLPSGSFGGDYLPGF